MCMGDSVSALGDVDGDGTTDFITLAARDNASGRGLVTLFRFR